jgi:hypothetical protein
MVTVFWVENRQNQKLDKVATPLFDMLRKIGCRIRDKYRMGRLNFSSNSKKHQSLKHLLESIILNTKKNRQKLECSNQKSISIRRTHLTDFKSLSNTEVDQC